MSFHPNIDMWVLGFAMLFLFSSVWLKSDTTRLSFGRTRGSKLLDLRYVVQQKNKKFEHPMFCRFHPFLPKLSTSVDLQKNAAFGPEMTDAWISLFQIARSIASNLSLTCGVWSLFDQILRHVHNIVGAAWESRKETPRCEKISF